MFEAVAGHVRRGRRGLLRSAQKVRAFVEAIATEAEARPHFPPIWFREIAERHPPGWANGAHISRPSRRSLDYQGGHRRGAVSAGEPGAGALEIGALLLLRQRPAAPAARPRRHSRRGVGVARRGRRARAAGRPDRIGRTDEHEHRPSARVSGAPGREPVGRGLQRPR